MPSGGLPQVARLEDGWTEPEDDTDRCGASNASDFQAAVTARESMKTRSA